jgi:hypothetical protein
MSRIHYFGASPEGDDGRAPARAGRGLGRDVHGARVSPRPADLASIDIAASEPWRSVDDGRVFIARIEFRDGRAATVARCRLCGGPAIDVPAEGVHPVYVPHLTPCAAAVDQAGSFGFEPVDFGDAFLRPRIGAGS